VTRTLYMSGTMLSQLQGFGAYRYTSTTAVTLIEDFVPAAMHHNHYEVSRPRADGSWWAPIGTSVPEFWRRYGGYEALKGIQNSNPGEYRPKRVYFWIPTASLEAQAWVPGTAPGAVEGAHPIVGP
jgi:hypothetical protein